jgi:predicted nucleic acid-binding protein
MTAACFVDTNIFVYARDQRQQRKQQRAAEVIKQLWLDRVGRTSIQVLNEYYVTLTRKLKPCVDAEIVWDDVLALEAWNPQPIDRQVMQAARDIERRYQTNWWDSLIVAAALEQQCKTLLSEDFQNGMVFGALTVRNPFAETIAESSPDYAYSMPLRHRPRGRPRKAV